MKVNGKEIKDMESDMSDLVMEMCTKENIFREKYLDKVIMNGNRVSFMKDSGRMARKMATVFGKDLKLTLMLDNGKLTNHMDSENMYGVIVTSTRANGKLASDTDKEVTSLL